MLIITILRYKIKRIFSVFLTQQLNRRKAFKITVTNKKFTNQSSQFIIANHKLIT
jgi:hypothetical protein